MKKSLKNFINFNFKQIIIRINSNFFSYIKYELKNNFIKKIITKLVFN